MKKWRIYPFWLLWLAVCLQGCMTHFEEEGEEEIEKNQVNEKSHDPYTLQYAWSGDTHKFTLSPQNGIQLNDPENAAGTAYLSFPHTTLANTSWEFAIRYRFNPSANNYARFYLSSSNPCLTEPLEGYYLQIGGKTDQLFFYRQEGTLTELLACSRMLMNDDKSPHLFIKITCGANGEWCLYSKQEKDNGYTLENTWQEIPAMPSTCCGIYCCYTKSRRKGIHFHHIQVSHPAFPDTLPPSPPAAEQPSKPVSSIRHALLFNEILYDPRPNEAPYIELYNPSDSVARFSSLKLIRCEAFIPSTQLSPVSHEFVLQPVNSVKEWKIPPHGYLCLTSSLSKLRQQYPTSPKNCVELKEFPAISRKNGCLIIATNEPQARTIDVCYYDSRMHNRPHSQHGCSLEKKSPELSSSNPGNWRSCQAANGGTPGQKNSLVPNFSKN